MEMGSRAREGAFQEGSFDHERGPARAEILADPSRRHFLKQRLPRRRSPISWCHVWICRGAFELPGSPREIPLANLPDALDGMKISQ